MKKMMSIVAVAVMMAGSMAFACDSCGCKDKAASTNDCAAKACCTAEKKCDKCTAEKPCAACAKKAEEAKKKAESTEAAE